MALGLIERMGLQKQALALKAQLAADNLGLIETLNIQNQWREIVAKLQGDAPPAADNTPPPDEEPTPAPDAEQEPEQPQIITDFLADKYVDQPKPEFIKTLGSLEPYLNSFITLDEIIPHAANWVAQNIAA